MVIIKMILVDYIATAVVLYLILHLRALARGESPSQCPDFTFLEIALMWPFLTAGLLVLSLVWFCKKLRGGKRDE